MLSCDFLIFIYLYFFASVYCNIFSFFMFFYFALIYCVLSLANYIFKLFADTFYEAFCIETDNMAFSKHYHEFRYINL